MPGGKNNLEYQFHQHFLENYSNILKGCVLIDHEVPLYNPYKVLSQDLSTITTKDRWHCWGRIDFVIRHGGTFYCVELKYPSFSSKEFWDSLKVLGYCKYYNWQMNANTKPAVMLPHQCYKLEHKITAIKLGLTMFEIIKDGAKFTVRKVKS